jgi:hypothetical protein
MEAAFSSIDKSMISESSTIGGDGGGGYTISMNPFGSFPPTLFMAFSRIFCHDSYRFTACRCSLFKTVSMNQSPRANIDVLHLSMLVLLHGLIEKVRVNLHKQLQCVVHHPVYGSVKKQSGERSIRTTRELELADSNEISSWCIAPGKRSAR